MAKYNYKVVYETFAHGYGKLPEKRFENYKDALNLVTNVAIISRHIWLYSKIKGKYELLHSIDGRMYYPGGLS